MNKLVSIVVPLYDYSCYIEELINSVKSQDYSAWELIIVDDFSSDNPYRFIKKHISSRITYFVLDKNCGYAVAKNEGIIRSSGDYIVVLDADDLLTSSSIRFRVNFLEKNSNFKWVHAKAYEFSRNIKKVVWRHRKFIRRFEKMQKTNNYKNIWDSIHAQTVMIKRECYIKVGLYQESMRSMSDKEMWARIQNNIGLPGYLNKFVVYYRCHNKQMHRSQQKKRNIKKLLRQLYKFKKARANGKFLGARTLER